MEKDYDGLENELKTNARYDASVRSGANSETERLLGEEDPNGSFVYSDVLVADVLDAVPPARLKALTEAERGRLLVLSGQSLIATSRSGIRAELIDVFGITEDQLATAIPSVRRAPTYGRQARSETAR